MSRPSWRVEIRSTKACPFAWLLALVVKNRYRMWLLSWTSWFAIARTPRDHGWSPRRPRAAPAGPRGRARAPPRGGPGPGGPAPTEGGPAVRGPGLGRRDEETPPVP